MNAITKIKNVIPNILKVKMSKLKNATILLFNLTCMDCVFRHHSQNILKKNILIQNTLQKIL